MALSTADRIALLTEAESLRTAAYDAIEPNVRDGAERAAAMRFVRLYETWETLSPNTGKASLALEWRRKLALLPPADTNGPPRELFR